MSTSVGPLFVKKLSLAEDLYEASLFDDNVYPLRDVTGDVFLFTIYSEKLAESLVGQETCIFVAEVVREDGYEYFAFANVVERMLFAQFRKINSIGPKLAALAVSRLNYGDLQLMVQTGKAPAGIKIAGLGPAKMLKLSQGLKAAAKKIQPLLAQLNAGKAVSGAEGDTLSIQQSVQGEVPAVILTSLERYGLKAAEVRAIYGQLLSEDSTAESWESAKVLKVIFQRWGQRNSRVVSKEGF